MNEYLYLADLKKTEQLSSKNAKMHVPALLCSYNMLHWQCISLKISVYESDTVKALNMNAESTWGGCKPRNAWRSVYCENVLSICPLGVGLVFLSKYPILYTQLNIKMYVFLMVGKLLFE